MCEKETVIKLVDNFVIACRQNRESVYALAEKFCRQHKIEDEKLSNHYHINVIEELHINENGHSRILCKILQYKNSEGRYVFLESLLNKIRETKSNFPKDVKSPTITQEEKRIDLWVRDNDYAIIFENKVYNAVDQEAQLHRYIEETLQYYQKEKNIYIVYMPESAKDPSDNSWGDYKEKFKDRYVCLPFNSEIMQWLQEVLRSDIVTWTDETELHTAVIQYLNFLSNLYSDKIQDMNKSLDNVIKETIGGLDVLNPKGQIDILSTFLTSLDDMYEAKDEKLLEVLKEDSNIYDSLRARLESLLNEAIHNYCDQQCAKMIAQNPDLRKIDDGYIDILLPKYKEHENEFSLLIWPERTRTYIYLSSKSGIFGGDKDPFKSLQDPQKFFEGSNNWNYWRSIDFVPSTVTSDIADFKEILSEVLRCMEQGNAC